MVKSPSQAGLEPDSRERQTMTTQRLTAIDLFCGAGGLSEGFRQAGYTVVAGNDIDAAAGETYKATHPDAEFILAPIQDVTVDRLCKTTGLRLGELDVLLGGPPCQAYSVYNHQRGMHDARASLFEQYLRIVEGMKPKWVVMENVTGITSIAGGTVVQSIKEELRKLGYEVECRVLKTEEYGVPQERRRVVFIGNRLGLPIEFPKPTHGPAGSGLEPFTTIWDAIGDLPPLANGEKDKIAAYTEEPVNWFQAYARENAGKTVLNHEAPRLSPVNEARMRHIPIGGSWRDIPYDLLPEGMKKAKRSDHTKRYGRMRPDGLSCTVLTKCDVHWGAYIHPYQDRAISVREAARIQAFPDSFFFHGSRTEQYVQVGNAVPPLLGRKVAEVLLKAGTTVRKERQKAA
ncbi:DNA (cytosine-5)-methyltransferase 1 [Oceanibaculum indicum]|uniref:Cytosine-specific methyltransferase n=2 Tax=Oceanibaculum indicum TaxID=526216 RepID=A0A420WN65_9PROT|nr:DNA (cytosine-5)-methyltransferase 1 [Oceanibaculum indicum]